MFTSSTLNARLGDVGGAAGSFGTADDCKKLFNTGLGPRQTVNAFT